MALLSIHKTTVSDLDLIVSMENDQENALFILPNTRAEHLALLQDTDIAHLILRSPANHIIGFIILAGLENKNRSVEFRRIVIQEKGKGKGRMAIREIKKHCFEKLKAHRLWLDVLDTNKRARHLYQSEGFKEEGVLRDSLLVNGSFKNLVVMSMLEDEYR